MWGTHMRARRRQGWWVCAFGVTAAVQVTHTFLDPSLTLVEAGLTTVYSILVGVLIGIVIIRLDLAADRFARPPCPPHRRPRCGAAARTPRVPGRSYSSPAVAREQRVEILAEMVANVLSVAVEVGDAVDVGDTVVLLESMKMEIPVIAESRRHRHARSRSASGDVVQEGDPLVAS